MTRPPRKSTPSPTRPFSRPPAPDPADPEKGARGPPALQPVDSRRPDRPPRGGAPRPTDGWGQGSPGQRARADTQRQEVEGPAHRAALRATGGLQAPAGKRTDALSRSDAEGCNLRPVNGARLTASAAGLLAAALSFWPMAVEAHSERPTHAPDGTGHVPAYRTAGPRMIVCKDDKADFEQRIATFPPALQQENRDLFALCRQNGYRDLQAAVDHVTAGGTTILVLPGLYQEGPSLAPQPDACNHLQAQVVPAGYQILSYEQQKECPHQQNLVGIFGIKDLQIEGTGAAPTDVVFDAEFQKLNVIRGDRANGLYLRNLTAERSTFNAVYVIETDGFVVDRVLGRWNTEYGFLSFAADHGLFKGCEAYGNGDSGIYPGGTSDVNRDRGFDVPRYAI